MKVGFLLSRMRFPAVRAIPFKNIGQGGGEYENVPKTKNETDNDNLNKFKKPPPP